MTESSELQGALPLKCLPVHDEKLNIIWCVLYHYWCPYWDLL